MTRRDVFTKLWALPFVGAAAAADTEVHVMHVTAHELMTPAVVDDVATRMIEHLGRDIAALRLEAHQIGEEIASDRSADSDF
jgi:hypothetical protein